MWNLTSPRLAIFVGAIVCFASYVAGCDAKEPKSYLGAYEYSDPHHAAKLYMHADGAYQVCLDRCYGGNYIVYSMNDHGGRISFRGPGMPGFIKLLGGTPEMGVRPDGTSYEVITANMRFENGDVLIDITGMGDYIFESRSSEMLPDAERHG